MRMEEDEGTGVLVSRDLAGTPKSARLLGEALAAEVFTVRGRGSKGTRRAWRDKPGEPRSNALGLYVRLAPAGVGAQALGLRKLIALRELDADRGEHGSPVADVGAAYRRLVARLEDRAVGPVAVEDVLDARRHSPTGSQPERR